MECTRASEHVGRGRTSDTRCQEAATRERSVRTRQLMSTVWRGRVTGGDTAWTGDGRRLEASGETRTKSPFERAKNSQTMGLRAQQAIGCASGIRIRAEQSRAEQSRAEHSLATRKSEAGRWTLDAGRWNAGKPEQGDTTGRVE
jgi:hypothetical protein